jgi:hypothetical protein
MSVISIRERGITSSSPVVAIDGQEYPLANPITPPFDEKAEAQLEWYFEEHLRFPFTNQVRAQEAATSIRRSLTSFSATGAPMAVTRPRYRPASPNSPLRLPARPNSSGCTGRRSRTPTCPSLLLCKHPLCGAT